MYYAYIASEMFVNLNIPCCVCVRVCVYSLVNRITTINQYINNTVCDCMFICKIIHSFIGGGDSGTSLKLLRAEVTSPKLPKSGEVTVNRPVESRYYTNNKTKVH